MNSIEDIFDNSNQLIDGIHHFSIGTSEIHCFGKAESIKLWTRLCPRDMNSQTVHCCGCWERI